MAEAERSKTCFVIAPIGEEESEIRERSNQVLTYIIKPAVAECGYQAVRADEISEPGVITSQVIQRIIDDDLVVADLTGQNPNVFYELAIRHTIRRPVILIIQAGSSIPFDVAPARTIYVDHRNLDSVAKCKDEIIRQIRSVEEDPSKVDSPISTAIDLQSLRQSDNPLEKSHSVIISMLEDLRAWMSSMSITLKQDAVRTELEPELLENISKHAVRIHSALTPSESGAVSVERIGRARHYSESLMRYVALIQPTAEADNDIPF